MPASQLIGREAELAALCRLLVAQDTRLVTLTGPPGVGKSRLALAAVSAVGELFPEGAVFVDLAPVRNAERVLAEIARACGVGASPGEPLLTRLAAATSGRALLVLVDNCEHLLAAMPDLARLLSASSRMRVLATSRERLHLAAEREFPVPPLPMPGEVEVADLERLAANPSVALLLERAAAPDLVLTRQNAHAMAEICRRLDGLPLAIELAAPRLKLFTPGELASRLEHRMVLLTSGSWDVPARHRALHTAVEWSHELLPGAERALFRRLSVFVGGWTLPAAERVCANPGTDILEAMASLLAKSLISRAARGNETAGFTMLESLREYAAQKLAEAGEEVTVRARHASYFADLAVEAEAGIGTAQETFWWTWMGYEHANLRAALDYCRARGDVSASLQVATALGWYWYTRGYLGEGKTTVDAVLDMTAEWPVASGVLAGALIAVGILAWARGELDSAEGALRRALVMSESAADRRRTGIASAFLGHVARSRGRCEEAARWHQRAAATYQRLGHTRGVAWARHDLGLLAWQCGNLDEAARLFREALRRFREIEYSWAIAWSAWGLGTVLLEQNAVDEAAELLAEALDGYRQADDRRGVAQCLEGLARVAVVRVSPEAAAQLLGAAAAMRLALAAPPSAAESEGVARLEAALTESLEPRRLDRARQAGRTMPLASVLELANRVGETADSRSATGPALSLLTRREQEVAGLVAAGRTNHQIARALGIADKTAETHVYNIMNKLAMHSRAEIAAWAAIQGLVSTRPR